MRASTLRNSRACPLALNNYPPFRIYAHRVHVERFLRWWIQRRACQEVETRKVKRACDRWRGGANGSNETAIELAIFMGADAIHGIEGAAPVDHKDCLAVRPGEARGAVGQFGCRE